MSQQSQVRKGATVVVTAAAAIAVAALSSAPASAAAKGAERPVKGYVSGTDNIHRPTFGLTAHVGGALSHLGENVTADFDGSGTLTPQGTTIAIGDVLITADNGDTLTGDFTIRGPAPSFVVHEIDVEIVVTGGSGRFDDAAGRLESTQVVRPFAFDGVTLQQASEGRVSGRLSY